jgi:hypothetical protein
MTKFNIYNLANPTGIPMTTEDVVKTRCRPPWLRTDLPIVGQRVHYRHEEYGPLVEAEILSVDMENRKDPCVWMYVLDDNRNPVELHGIRVMELVPDPWPSVRLRVTGSNMCYDTREARFPGSPGWLPRSVKE